MDGLEDFVNFLKLNAEFAVICIFLEIVHDFYQILKTAQKIMICFFRALEKSKQVKGGKSALW